ncbi:MAG: UDP-N-acetylmuramoyl-tripeptide--D-alanyl-D-alanine ligase [Candidatus Rokuibacteriota bacterium]
MSLLTVQEVVRAIHGALVGGDLGVPVTGVSIDSRTLEVGEAFFAIRGHHLDGHAFVRDAAARGASCLIVHHLPDQIPPDVPVILVDDTTRALARVAAFHRSRFAVPLVAVTGSNGKTTTKEMVAAILAALGPVLKSAASFNNQWGLPLTLLKLRSEHQAAVVELGANQRGEIAALAEVARPTVGIVTTVAAVHTEFFGSLEEVQREKGALVRAIPAEGRVILNGDDARVRAMAGEACCPVLFYGMSAEADVRAAGPIDEAVQGLSFTLEVGGARSLVRLPFAGRHNVLNALAAAAAGTALGLSLPEIVQGLERARPLKGRCVWRRAGGVRILDDTYNANPAAVDAALAILARAQGAGRILVALGDMLELGERAEAAHREAGCKVAQLGVAEFVGVGLLARHAAEAARDAGLAESHHVETTEGAVALLLKRLVPGDCLLVKGSRGMRMERVVDALVARLGGGE